MKATEQYFPVVFFFFCSRPVALTFKSVDEILKHRHSNESYRAVLFCGAVLLHCNNSSSVKSVDDILRCDYPCESW